MASPSPGGAGLEKYRDRVVKTVVQRVTRAEVRVGNERVGAIETA